MRAGFETPQTPPLPALSLCFMLAVEHVSSRLPVSVIMLPLAVMVDSRSSGTVSQNKLFLPEVHSGHGILSQPQKRG